MAIAIETFRAFVNSGIADSKTVNIGNEEKSALSLTRFTDSRPLASREIKQVEASQDNIYLRSQLLAGVREALGGEDDAYFTELQEKLFGVSDGKPQADLKIASKALTTRDVKAALSGLDARLAQKAVARAFAQRIETDFGGNLSTRTKSIVRSILLPQLRLEQAANPGVDLATLTGEGSAFSLLLDRCRKSGNTAILIQAQNMEPEHVKAYLRACDLLIPGKSTGGMDIRLAMMADKVAKLSPSKFTPVNLFRLIHPDVGWPKTLSTKLNRLSNADYGVLYQAYADSLTTDIDRKLQDERFIAEFPALTQTRVAVSLMFDQGMSVADVRAALKMPWDVHGQMLPARAFLSGVQAANHGIEDAFSQSVKDFERTTLTISIPRSGQSDWTLPAAAMLGRHPLHKIACAEYRAAVEGFCGGPQVNEAMKTNIFLFMSQSAQSYDGVFGRLLETGNSGSLRGYHYAFSSNPDGSVTVARTARGRQAFNIEVAIKFNTDGSQDVVWGPQVTFDRTVTPQIREKQESETRQAVNDQAKQEFNLFVDANLAQPFARLFDAEACALEARFPAVAGKHTALLMRARNIANLEFGEKTDLVEALAAKSPADRSAALEAYKTGFSDKVQANMMALALKEQMLADARKAILSAIGLAEDAKAEVDLRKLEEKLNYLHFKNPMDEEMEDKFKELTRTIVQQRIASLQYLQGLEDVTDEFRAAALSEELLRPRVGLEGLKLAMAVSREIPLPPIGWKHDKDSVKAMCFTIARTIQTRFSDLNQDKYGAEQKGHMATLILISLLKNHAEEISDLIKAGTETDWNLMEDLMNDYPSEKDPDLALYLRMVAGFIQEEGAQRS